MAAKVLSLRDGKTLRFLDDCRRWVLYGLIPASSLSPALFEMFSMRPCLLKGTY